MSTASEQLIRSIHPALSADAEGEPVISLVPSADTWIAIDDLSMTVILDDTSAPQLFVLADYTIAELVAALPAQLGAALISSDWADVQAFSLMPISGEIFATSGTANLRLYSYTAGLWRVVRPIAAGLAQIAGNVDSLLRQTDIYQATIAWLNLWGLIYNIPRLAFETDDAYRNRIIYTLTLPRANNRALELLILRALGRVAYVEDGGLGGIFMMNGTNTISPGGTSVWGPQSYGNFVVTLQTDGAEDTAPLIELINGYKAAGTNYTLNTLFAPTASITFADIQATWEA